ncbi:DUF4192 domain-containing protein [Actinoplanes sp. NBC_00393]|uniref:DUF4192 domain-containing protein n=1 Tax=Actinoplanes sp. NBC_00393 TaxID=2975953 RepID=UPI002E2304A5
MNNPNVFRLTSLPDTVGLAPYLIGYQPTDSLVALAQHDHQIVFALATPLPQGARFDTEAARIARLLVRKNTETVFLIGYGTAQPVEVAVDATTDALRQAGIPVMAAARVHDGRLWHLNCADRLCPASGVPFDAASTATAAQATVAGLVALPDRTAVAAGLQPTCDDERDATSAAVARAFIEVAHQLAAAAGGDRNAETELGRLAETLAAEAVSAAGSGERLSDQRAALLLVLLSMPRIWDTAARHVDHTDAQIRAWTDLTRRAEDLLVPGPALMLVLAALQAGNGVLADAAVHRVLDADPDDALARTLLQAIQLGIDPQVVSRILRH